METSMNIHSHRSPRYFESDKDWRLEIAIINPLSNIWLASIEDNNPKEWT
jgi:hypothetical protein